MIKHHVPFNKRASHPPWIHGVICKRTPKGWIKFWESTFKFRKETPGEPIFEPIYYADAPSP